MKIDSIKNYVFDKEIFMKLADEIYNLTIHLNDVYPGYKQWFYNKQIKECLFEKRNIIFCKDDNEKVIAFCSLKKTDEEKKICTLFVLEKHRRQGIGSLLLEESMEFLETTKPLVTFSEDKIDMFLSFIDKYEWKLTEIIDGIYDESVKEFCFNGVINNKK